MKNVVPIIRCFEAVSGLKINLFKSELIRIGVEGQALNQMPEFMGCKVGALISWFTAVYWECF